MEGMRLESVASPPDSNDVIYVSTSQDGNLPLEQLGVYKSTDSGMTWRYLPGSQNPVCGALTIDHHDQATVYLGSFSYWYDPNAWSRKTRDAGTNWEQFEEELLYRIVPSPWTSRLLLATQTFGGNYGLHISTDDGQTWQGLCGAEISLVSDEIVFSWGDSVTVMACLYEGSQGGRWGLCRSRYGGYTWEQSLAGRVSGFDQDPVNADHWIAVVRSNAGDVSLLFESFDNGDTWESRPLPDGIFYVEQVFFDLWNPQTIYLGGASAWVRLGNYRSTDGGYTWETMNDGLPDLDYHWEIQQLRDPPGEMLMARWDGVWRWTNRVLADGSPLGGVETLRIEAVAPCPFRDKLTAGFLCGEPGPVTAGVYSLEGRLVRTLTERAVGAGRHKLSWDGRRADGESAAPGVYVLRLASPTGRVATTVVKVR